LGCGYAPIPPMGITNYFACQGGNNYDGFWAYYNPAYPTRQWPGDGIFPMPEYTPGVPLPPNQWNVVGWGLSTIWGPAVLATKIPEVTDGLSSTILFGEGRTKDSVFCSWGNQDDLPRVTAIPMNRDNKYPSGLLIYPDAHQDNIYFSSAHPGGANFALA